MILAAPLATPSDIANRLIVAIRSRMSPYHLPMYPPISAQPAKNPARGPSVTPTSA
jgi:hypothetical protein